MKGKDVDWIYVPHLREEFLNTDMKYRHHKMRDVFGLSEQLLPSQLDFCSLVLCG
jgi:hypothetical protein